MADLLKAFEVEIKTITLAPSDGGRFEVTVNNQLIYSKLQTGRHAEPAEVTDLIEKLLKKQ